MNFNYFTKELVILCNFLAGFGKLYYKDGSFYVGEFENGEKNGFGKMVFSVTDDRDSFEGKKNWPQVR